MSGHCHGCGTYHEEDDGRLCAKCNAAQHATVHTCGEQPYCDACTEDALAAAMRELQQARDEAAWWKDGMREIAATLKVPWTGAKHEGTDVLVAAQKAISRAEKDAADYDRACVQISELRASRARLVKALQSWKELHDERLTNNNRLRPYRVLNEALAAIEANNDMIENATTDTDRKDSTS